MATKTKKVEQVQDEIGVNWYGRKSKHSNALGSGGYTAEAHKAELHVREDRDGGWYFTVTTFRVGKADSLESVKAAALDVARRLSEVQ